MAFFHNGQSYWIVLLRASLRQHSNFKCQPSNYQNMFPNPGFINFPQEKSPKSAMALPEVPTEHNCMVVMVRSLIFSSSLFQALRFYFSFCLRITIVHTVWPLSQGSTFTKGPPCHQALWASMKGSNLLAATLNLPSLPLHIRPPICATDFHRPSHTKFLTLLLLPYSPLRSQMHIKILDVILNDFVWAHVVIVLILLPMSLSH